jgi:hypothetical protein
MKLSVKDIKAGAVNVYAVTLTVHVHHQSAAKAQSYIETAIADWAVDGKVIPCLLINSVTESPVKYHVSGVKYPTEEAL